MTTRRRRFCAFCSVQMFFWAVPYKTEFARAEKRTSCYFGHVLRYRGTDKLYCADVVVNGFSESFDIVIHGYLLSTPGIVKWSAEGIWYPATLTEVAHCIVNCNCWVLINCRYLNVMLKIFQRCLTFRQIRWRHCTCVTLRTTTGLQLNDSSSQALAVLSMHHR